MNIVLITGSPRKNGNSDKMANAFTKGATEQGHEVYKFDAAFKNVHPCIACDTCQKTGKCVFEDDMVELKEKISQCDMLVFATPVYYFGWSAQIKAVFDRFYDSYNIICDKKSALLLSLGDGEEETVAASVEMYKSNMRYLKWTDMGMIIAYNCMDKDDIDKFDYCEQAYNLGKSL